MKVLVCGGRDFDDSTTLETVLNELHATIQITYLIHGAATGADTLAGQWAKKNNVPCRAYPANWDKNGRAAGPIRNKLMLDKESPDLVVAFSGGKGTENMLTQAKKYGVKIKRYL